MRYEILFKNGNYLRLENEFTSREEAFSFIRGCDMEGSFVLSGKDHAVNIAKGEVSYIMVLDGSENHD